MSQFKGTYVFKQNGVEVGRSENLITNNGRKIIMQYLAGIKNNWASNIGIGAISTTPTLNDVELNFETARFPVTLKTFKSAVDLDPDLIILRTTLPANMYANIYEIGTYPNNAVDIVSNKNNRIITDFSDLTNWVTDGGQTYITGFMPMAEQSPRIGGYSVELTPSTSFNNNTFSFSISEYSNKDNLQILAYNTVQGTLTVKLKDINGYYANFVYNLSDNSGYQILSAAFPAIIVDSNGNSVSSSTQLLGTINSITISTDTTAVVTVDAIKASATNEVSSTDYIISKSVLTTPIAKDYGTTLDIEYYIQLL